MQNGKVVLITGCSSGIGKELCREFSQRGYGVIATARNKDRLKAVPAELRLSLDVTRPDTIQSAIQTTLERFQKIDILVNNAGYALRGVIEDIDDDSLRRLFDVNVFGLTNMIRAVLPEMRRNGSGKIINIGSISGRFSQPVNGSYCATKHAVEAISDALRLELYPDNIQSTVIEPGPIGTNFFETSIQKSQGILLKPNLAYAKLYQSFTEYMQKQIQADPAETAQIIADIIGRKTLKPRYLVSVPAASRMILHFPDELREYLLRLGLQITRPPSFH